MIYTIGSRMTQDSFSIMLSRKALGNTEGFSTPYYLSADARFSLLKSQP